ncbi:hypothetical protein J6590_052679 [Homalodisca vitripennis]|nr:hypothetical protein J6590_052679 [Homalodisca vitripennis]
MAALLLEGVYTGLPSPCYLIPGSLYSDSYSSSCLTDVSYSSVPQVCTRIHTAALVLQMCPIVLSHSSVPQVCTRIHTAALVLQMCPIVLSHRSVHGSIQQLLSYRCAPYFCPTGLFTDSNSSSFLTDVPHSSVPQVCTRSVLSPAAGENRVGNTKHLISVVRAHTVPAAGSRFQSSLCVSGIAVVVCCWFVYRVLLSRVV